MGDFVPHSFFRRVTAVMKRIRYIEELNYFNGIACLLVILIHVLSLGVVSLRPGTWQGFCVFLPWRISQFVVPAFLFSGAVKMSLTFSDLPEEGAAEAQKKIRRQQSAGYWNYLLERCRTILLPYAVFFLVYYAAYWAAGLLQPSWNALIRGFVTGDLSGHFYYIMIVVQFYLLKPVWARMTVSVPWQAGIGAALLIQAATAGCLKIFSTFPKDFPYADSFFPLYLFFWIGGLYAGRYYARLASFLSGHRVFIFFCGGAVIFSALGMYAQHVQGRYLPMMDGLKILIDSLSILTLLAVCIGIKKRRRLKTLLGKISGASYQVYLSHCLFLTLGTVWLQQAGILRIGHLLLCRAAVGYTLPFVLYFLTAKAWEAGRQYCLKRVAGK